MKWFKFIIYFQLIYTGISCCFQFFAYLGLEQLVDTLQQYNLGSLIPSLPCLSPRYLQP